MTTSADELPADLEACHRLIRELIEALRRRAALDEELRHQLERLLRRAYGPRAERIDPGQLLRFAREALEGAGEVPGAGPAPAPDESAPAPAAAPTAPRKEGHGREPLPAHLARRRIAHDVPAERRTCPDRGAERSRIGEEVREQLEYVPAGLVVIEHVRPKYACLDCRAHVVIADRLPEPIEKGRPGPGLLAYVITSE